MKVRIVKSLGTIDHDAERIEARGLFNSASLLPKAEAERTRREAAGISDSVEAGQQPNAPAFDSNLIGKQLEVCWPYKENGKQVNIWASGKVKRIADGLTDTRSPRARKILPAGALLWAWDADQEYNEEAGEQWLVLLPEKWNKHVAYSWRFDPCELECNAAQNQQKKPPRRPIYDCVTDDESDDE